jgi:hypothetical protein
LLGLAWSSSTELFTALFELLGFTKALPVVRRWTHLFLLDSVWLFSFANVVFDEGEKPNNGISTTVLFVIESGLSIM